MGIFGKDRELFKPEYNKNQYSIQSNTRQSYSQKEITLEENISLRCPIYNLQKIWAKNFIMLTMLPVLFIIGNSILASLTSNYDMILIFIFVFIFIYSGMVLKNMLMKDRLVNIYIIRKTKFYEILYKKISEKYTVSAEYSNKINGYIKLFPKKYKMRTAVKELAGFILIFAFLFVYLLIAALADEYEFEPFNHYNDVLFIVIFAVTFIIISKFFMINPLKRKNEIWYEISLFEKGAAETFQQIIPDSNKNKKILNYPVDKTLKQPFALYLTASIFTGFFFIIWDYQMVMAKQKYLSKAYLVEDYFAGLA